MLQEQGSGSKSIIAGNNIMEIIFYKMLMYPETYAPYIIALLQVCQGYHFGVRLEQVCWIVHFSDVCPVKLLIFNLKSLKAKGIAAQKQLECI